MSNYFSLAGILADVAGFQARFFEFQEFERKFEVLYFNYLTFTLLFQFYVISLLGIGRKGL